MPKHQKEIDVHFVQNETDPTGMGEPPFPLVFAALANAIYGTTKKRLNPQPFFGEEVKLGLNLVGLDSVFEQTNDKNEFLLSVQQAEKDSLQVSENLVEDKSPVVRKETYQLVIASWRWRWFGEN